MSRRVVYQVVLTPFNPRDANEDLPSVVFAVPGHANLEGCGVTVNADLAKSGRPTVWVSPLYHRSFPRRDRLDLRPGVAVWRGCRWMKCRRPFHIRPDGRFQISIEILGQLRITDFTVNLQKTTFHGESSQ